MNTSKKTEIILCLRVVYEDTAIFDAMEQIKEVVETARNYGKVSGTIECPDQSYPVEP